MKLLRAIAIGDSYGASFEFNTDEFIEDNNLLSYVTREGKKTRMPKYTDDTQMSIAVAEFMLHNRSLTHKNFAFAFSKAYNRDKRQGYSRRTAEGLGKKDTDEMLEYFSCLDPRDSNGCVMRALPLGLMKDTKKIVQAAIIQTTVTHHTQNCIDASVFTALSAHYFYYGFRVNFEGWMRTMMGFRAVEIINEYSPERYVRIENDAISSISFSVNNMLYPRKSMSNILKDAIAVKGDVDTTASISLGLAALAGRKDDLPRSLKDNLEKTKYGRAYIDDLDNKLYKKFKK